MPRFKVLSWLLCLALCWLVAPRALAARPHLLESQFITSGQPTTFSAGRAVSFAVTVTNTGPLTWPAAGANPVALVIAFISAGETCPSMCAIMATTSRYALPRDLARGFSMTFNVSPSVPTTTGPYTLEYRMLQDGVGWSRQFLDSQVTVAPPPTPTSTSPVEVSSDPFAAGVVGQHATQVEPDTYSWGNTVVSAFQTGRIYDGGSTAIGWATFIDSAWHHGFLPGVTVNNSPAGQYDRVSDPSVAYDAAHGTWLVSSLALTTLSGVTGAAILVSRSSDGVTWSAPVAVRAGNGDYDKDWIVCDNSPTSAYYGHCYAQWDAVDRGDLIQMSTSTDGGLTWSAPVSPAGNPVGIGGQPVVQPNGTVVVPLADDNEAAILSFLSSDGGATWSTPVTVSAVSEHGVAGGMRTGPLPSAEVDGNGRVYVAWQDCRFEPGCSANDIVLASSSDGNSWSTVSRVPIDGLGSGFDHFNPGLAVNPNSGGNSANLAITYDYYPDTNCALPCQVGIGIVSSVNGGASWSAPRILASPQPITLLPQTNQGYMLGDYQSTSFLNGSAVSVYAAPQSATGGAFNVPMVAAISTASGGPTVSTLSSYILADTAHGKQEALTAHGDSSVLR